MMWQEQQGQNTHLQGQESQKDTHRVNQLTENDVPEEVTQGGKPVLGEPRKHSSHRITCRCRCVSVHRASPRSLVPSGPLASLRHVTHDNNSLVIIKVASIPIPNTLHWFLPLPMLFLFMDKLPCCICVYIHLQLTLLLFPLYRAYMFPATSNPCSFILSSYPPLSVPTSCSSFMNPFFSSNPCSTI